MLLIISIQATTQHHTRSASFQTHNTKRPGYSTYTTAWPTTQDQHSLVLRKLRKNKNKIGRGGIRTPDLLVRSQILYPTKLHVLEDILAKYRKDV